MMNLENSFPSKSVKERNEIARKFYNHLCDLLVESVKLFSVTEKQIVKRFTVNNPEILQSYFDQGRSVILVGGHYNSWEMFAAAIDQKVTHQTVGIYAKLSNAFFNKVVLASRSKFGLRMITTREVSSYFNEEWDKPTATIFGADQSPTHSKKVHWMTFLNQETAIALGTERFAKKHNYPVLYGAINKVKRGHYSLDIVLLSENPQETKDGEISEAHTHMLEKYIIDQPEFWLWTHRRWKRKR